MNVYLTYAHKNSFFSWSIREYLCLWLNKSNCFVVHHESIYLQFWLHIFFARKNVTQIFFLIENSFTENVF